MTKTEQVRITTWRSKVLQHAAATSNVARTCRRFGISRKSFYKWRRRFVEHGDAGLCDRPRAPRRSPRATADDVIFGAGRIADYLKRFHQVTVARSTVHRILTRRGLQRLPAKSKASRARQALAAIRKTTARPSAAGGREVPRTDSGHAPPLLPVHGH